MGVFDQFPYTNFHELNLDWILQALKEIEKTMDAFVSINALKYADPIQWDITTQYEKNTIVIEPNSGTAYISVQPVPSGVSIANTDYWTVVFDLGMFVVRAAKNLATKYEEDTTNTATQAINKDEWFVWGDTLYKALSNIIAGDQFVIGSNIDHFTIESVTGHLEDLTTTDQSNLVAAINEVLQTLVDTCGDLVNLTTTDKSNLVAAINEVLQTLNDTCGDLVNLTTTDQSNLVNAINELDSEIGDLSTLTTIDQSNLVNAINEVNTTGGGALALIGDLTQLTTTDKTDLVHAINEVDGNADDALKILENTDVFNVMDYGAVADGITDDSQAVRDAYNDMPLSGGILYFPPGTYQLNTGVEIFKSITVYFNCATVLCSDPAANFQVKTSNVEFKGKANFGNNGGARLALIFDGNANILFDLDCNVVSFISNPLITSYQNAFVIVRGKYSTQDSMIFLSDGSSYVDVSGVMALYTTTPALGPIICTDSDPTHTYAHINIHDNFVEGGNVLVNGCITVTRSEQTDGVSGKNYLPIEDVKLTNNTVSHTAGITDGLDVLFCDGVTMTNNKTNHCFEGMAILSDNVVVANCICTENRSAGIYIGDLNIGSSGTHWDLITITNCILANNGFGTDPNARPAALASDQPATCYASSIYIENTFMFGSDWAVYFGDNTGGSNIRVSNSFTLGGLGGLRYIAGQEGQFKMTNNAGYNPLGFITPPAISTTPVVNDTTTDVWVTIMNDAIAQTVDINSTPVAAIPANGTYGFILPKGVSASLSTDATNCSWSWYAL